MKDSYYFSHDFNARNDPKMQKLLRIHGVAGIGVFWCIVEQLYEQGGAIQIDSLCDMAFAMHIEQPLIESIVNDFGLFQNDGEMFWSASVNARLGRRMDRAEKCREAARRKWAKHSGADGPGSSENESNPDPGKSECDANAMRMQTTDDANAMQGKERKVKERKKEKTSTNVEVKKEKPPSRFSPPSIDEVKRHFSEKCYGSSPELFFAFYESKGWFVGRNRMRSWRAAAAGWECREKERRRREPCRQEIRENEKNSDNEWK